VIKRVAPAKNIARLTLVHTFSLLVWITQSPVDASALQADPERALALYWYGKDFPANVEFDRGVQKVFRTAGIDYHAEYFEPNRFPGEQQAVALRDYLHTKYSERKIDVVIAMSPVAADFLLKYRDHLFPNVPLVFHMNTRAELEQRAGRNFPGVLPDNIHARTLDTALRFHPATERVFVVSGTIERNKAVERLLKEQLSGFENRVAITYLTDLPLEELLSRVKNVPAQSLIFYSRQDYEEPGRSLSVFDVLSLISASAKVPIYSSGRFVGHGTAGGYTVNTYECGIQAAGMALRILNGAQPRDIPFVEVPSFPIFDWRQLRRWGINEDQLPSGSEIRFKEPTLFEQYRWRIIGGLALLAIQSMLITGLLLERGRRRRVQGALRERLEFETLLAELSADFTRSAAGAVELGIEKWLLRMAESLGASCGSLYKAGDNAQSASERFDSNANVAVSDKKAIPPKRILAIPIRVDGAAWILTFSGLPLHRGWSEDVVPRLRLAGEILAGALIRKTGGEALQQSQERYRLATSSGGVVVWDWNLKTSEFYADPLLKSLLGYDDWEIRDHVDDWARLVHPDDLDYVNRLRAQIHAGTPQFKAELRLLRKDGVVRWFLVSGTVLFDNHGIPIRAVGTDTDITERKLAERELQHLSARLLDSQDQERRRIARELHDGTAQNLCAMVFNLEYIKQSEFPLPDKLQRMLSDCQAHCQQSLQEIRTLSYLLHPPMIDQVGLHKALRWYVDGFAKRSGIDVELIATSDIGRLPAAIEMDLFRVVQECLANIHRHSGSRTALVRLDRQSDQVSLQVEDKGRGMPVKILRAESEDAGLFGVGLSGMRQRLRHIGGRLEIESGSHGTTITAIVPVPVEPGLMPIVEIDRTLEKTRVADATG